MPPKRRICFVTGTRAEFGLMERVLRTIAAHRSLSLQIIATGMHLDLRHGRSIEEIRQGGWKIDATVPWSPSSGSPVKMAIATANASAALARAFDRLQSDIILVVGDRVEAFAAASAAHLSGRIVAHIHGGDSAVGQIDDCLRHAITKLAHIHFPATSDSAQRIQRLGEDRWRIHRVGSPGVEAIADVAAPARLLHKEFGVTPHRFALLLLHPADADERSETRRAKLVLNATESVPFDHIIVVYPNNDPGSRGIIQHWKSHPHNSRLIFCPNISRPHFLGLLRDAAVLIGNSSSGIIEAASFHTPVIDIGPRQLGRQRGQNVTNVPYSKAAIAAALRSIWNDGHPRRAKGDNIYAAPRTASRIANILAVTPLDARLRRKLIAY